MKISILMGTIFFMLFPVDLYSENLDEIKIIETVEEVKSTLPEKCNKFYSEFKKYDWDVEIAMEIMYWESGCNETVINDNHNTKDYSVGLMQINLYGANRLERPNEELLKTAEHNIAYAYELYKTPTSWFHWSVYKSKGL